MSLATVRNKIDDWLTPKWANLANKQEIYFTANSRYFQGLWTHTVKIIQTDALNGDKLADKLAAKPTDQIHDWRDLIGTALDAILLPARLRIDVYDVPRGKGWAAKLQVEYKGDI